MITIGPMEESSRKDNLLNNLRSLGAFEVISLKDGSEELANAVISISGDCIQVLQFNIDGCDKENPSSDEKLYIDFLVRSIASYGEHHDIDYISTRHGSFDSIFISMGFEDGGEYLKAPISRFVRKFCQ